MSKVTNTQKKFIRDSIHAIRSSYEPGTCRISEDGKVTVISDPMPNTNQRGRVFVGYANEVLDELLRQVEIK